jgi:dihydroorotase
VNNKQPTWLIENGHLICPVSGLNRVGRLLLRDGMIAAVDPTNDAVPNDALRVDAAGWMVTPGLIDLATEMGEPGREDDENIETSTMAAVAGGFTTVACAPNTDPPIDTAQAVEFIRQKAARADRCRVYVIGCVSKGRAGEELAEIGSLVDAGAVALSDFPNPISNAALLRRALEYCLMFDRYILDRPEVPSLTKFGIMHEGMTQLVLGLPPMPAEAEDLATSRNLRLLETTGGKLLLSCISTAGSVDVIRRAKERGLQVSAGTCLANLCFSDDQMRSFDANLKVNPPLRSRDHIQSCIQALADGTLDILISGHQPKALEKKMQELSVVPFGMSTLDTALAQMITFLVRPGHLSWPRAIEAFSTKPARVIGVEGGSLRVGQPADVLAFDPNLQWVVGAEDFYSRSRNNPLLGQALHGRTEMVWVDGRLKFCRSESASS